MSLEQYSLERTRLRNEVIAHKQLRNVQVGSNMTWCFEDRTTIRYQVLEMLRAERIFESAGIQDELDAYNPLIPSGSNWKATLLLEFPDPEQRRVALGNLIGVEDRCWMRVSEMDRVFAIANEDIERENPIACVYASSLEEVLRKINQLIPAIIILISKLPE